MKKNFIFTILFLLMVYNSVCVYGQDAAADANKRGMDALEKKDYDNAITEFTKAIRLNPNNAILYLKRGEAYYWEEDYDSAITDYTHATQLNIEDALSGSGSYNRRQDEDIAITALTHAIQLKPDFERAYYTRGLMYYWKAYSKDEAISDFTKVIQLNPNNAEAYALRGWAFYKKTFSNNKDKDSALADANSAMLIDPDNDAANELYDLIIDEQRRARNETILFVILSILCFIVPFFCLYFFIIRPKRISIKEKKFLLVIRILCLVWAGFVVCAVFFFKGIGGLGLDTVFPIFIPIDFIYVLLCFYFFVIRPIARKIKRGTSQIKEKMQYRKIPDICPHCKNPNPNNLSVCEWCGNKIC